MLNKELNSILNNALEFSKSNRHEYVTIEHVFFSLLSNAKVIELLRKVGADTEFLYERIKTHLDSVFKPLPEDNYHDPFETVALARVIDSMITHIKGADKKQANIEDLLAALFVEERSYSVYLLKQQGISKLEILEASTDEYTKNKIYSTRKSSFSEIKDFIITYKSSDSFAIGDIFHDAEIYTNKHEHLLLSMDHLFLILLKKDVVKNILKQCNINTKKLYKNVSKSLETNNKSYKNKSYKNYEDVTEEVFKTVESLIKGNKKKHISFIDLLVSIYDKSQCFTIIELKKQKLSLNNLKKLKSTLAEKTKLNEVKVVFIGDARVGKTSLIKKLHNEILLKDEEPTIEVNISYYTNKDDIVAHFWDFGGQIIMHNIHPFFLTDNALYILVLDATKDHNPIYWLNYIKYYANNAPVMIVNNKSEGEFKNQLEISTLRYKYKNILHDDYKISCTEDIGIKEFKDDLDINLQELYSKNINMPYNWIDTKNEIQKTYNNKNFDYNSFIEICEENNIITEKDQQQLLTILNNVGVLLSYKKSEDYDTLICNPKWLTYAIYNIIINKNIIKKQGIISKDTIKKILLDKKHEYNYSRQEINFIIELLVEFQLAFYNKNKNLVFPNHLSQYEIKHSFNTDSSTLNFNYRFEFYPVSIFTILLAKLQNYSYQDLYWRHGILLKYENILALIKEDINDKKIHIYIQNKTKNMQSKQRDFLSIIREKIKSIILEFNEVTFKYNEYVFYKGIELDYQDLLGHEEGGVYKKFIPKLNEHIDVKKILNGFITETDRSYDYKHKTIHTYNIKEYTVKSKQTIKGNATVGNAVMAKEIDNSFNITTQLPSNEELKKLLELLNQEALKIKNNLTEDKIDDFIEDVELLTKQANKENPNKRQLNISIDGIMDATKSVGEVGNIMLEIIPKIIPYFS